MAQQNYGSVREYIGARYVPVFANPAQWDNGREYEPLTIVMNEGNSYTSTQYVPTGIDINNETYWALTGNYNAQVEAYRKEVQTFDNRITTNTNDIETNMAEIADLKKSVNSINTKTSDKIFIVIGDSFSTNVGSDPSGTPLWHTIVANKMGWTVDNFAVNGTGFVAGGNDNFINQLNRVIAKYPTGEGIAHIAVFGGWNDVRIDANPNNEILNMAISINSHYPNIPCTFMLGNTFVNQIIGTNALLSTLYNSGVFFCMTRGIRVIDMSMVNIGHNVAFNNVNNIIGAGHPNKYGEATFASIFMGSEYAGVIVDKNATIETNNATLVGCTMNYWELSTRNGISQYYGVITPTEENIEIGLPYQIALTGTPSVPQLGSYGQAIKQGVYARNVNEPGKITFTNVTVGAPSAFYFSWGQLNA